MAKDSKAVRFPPHTLGVGWEAVAKMLQGSEPLLAELGLEPEMTGALGRLISRMDPQLRHRFIDASCEQLLGLSPADFLGRTNEDLGMPPRLVRLWNEQFHRVFRRAEPQELEFRTLLTGKDWQSRPARFHSRLIPELGAEGQVLSVLSVVDVYPATRLGRRAVRPPRESPVLSLVPEPVTAPVGKPRAHSLSAEERLAWVTRVGQTLASRLDKQELFQCIEEVALPLLGDRGGVVLQREQGVERMALFPAGLGEEQGPWARLLPPVIQVLRTGRAQLLSGVPELVLQAVALDEEHLHQLRAEGLTDFLAVPLIRGGEAYGCLWFASTDSSGPLGAKDLALAETLALLASPAIDAARLRRIEREIRQRDEVLNRRTEDLRRVAASLGQAMLPARIAHAVMSEVKAALLARAAVVYRVAADGTAAELLHASGYDSRVTRQYERIPLTWHTPVTTAVKQREAIWVESGAAFRESYPELASRLPDRREGAWVALPLWVEGRVLGVLAFSFDATRTFTQEERAFALVLAQLCAQALERARLYQDLQEQLEELRTLLTVLPVGIGISRDRECLHIKPNPALARMLGITPEENVSLGAPELERVPGLQLFQRGRLLETQELPMQQAALSGRPVSDFEMDVEMGGEPRATILSFAAPLFDRENRPRGAVGAFLDITGRKRAGEAQRFLAESSAVLSYSIDLERTSRVVTQLCVPTLGSFAALYSTGLEGQARLLFLHTREPGVEPQEDAPRTQPGGLLGELVRQCLESAQPRLELEVEPRLEEEPEPLRTRLTKLGLHSLLAVPLLAQGRVAYVLVCGARKGEAVPDVRLAQEFAERAALALDNARLYQEAREAIALREQFVAVAGHELRTPLTALLLGLENLHRRGLGEPPEAVQRRIAQCRSQAEQLKRLINELLDVTRLTRGSLQLEVEELELVSLVRDVVQRMQPQLERAGCALTLASEEPLIGWWDRLRLEQVLTNLLTNASKYGAGRPIDVAISSTLEHAMLQVKDHGIGIAPEDQARIFQRFERAVSEKHYGGLGLGLWISQELLGLMGGRIEVRSEPGQGSTFTVYLPRQGAASRAGAEVRPVAARPHR